MNAVQQLSIGQRRILSLEKTIQDKYDLIRDRQRRISEGSTDMDDCFISQRSNEQSISEAQMKLDILKNGGVMPFDVLMDIETGDIVSKNTYSGQYGPYWRIEEKFESKFGKYVGVAKRESTYTKKGLKVEEVDRPAWVAFSAGSGGGMMAAYTGAYQIFPSSKNYFTEE